MKNLDRKTRKLMTMNGALLPRSNVNRLYVPRTRSGKGLVSCKGCIESEVNNLGWYFKNSTETLLIGARVTGVLNTDGCTTKMEFQTELECAESERVEKEKDTQAICERTARYS